MVQGQQRACMPLYIRKSRDLVRWHRCLTDWQTSEYRATQLVSSIKHKLSHAIICKKMFNTPKVNYQNTEKKTVRARMCKKIFRAGRRATRVQISPPFTVFTLALSCIHPVFTPCLHCILASGVIILYSHCSILYLLYVSNFAMLKLRNSSVAIR